MHEPTDDETTSGQSFPHLAESMGDRWLLNHSPATTPLESFYLPLLSSAASYDRAVGYWTANEIRLSAQGMAEFLSHAGKMRLIVGAQLQESDIAPITEGTPIDEALAISERVKSRQPELAEYEIRALGELGHTDEMVRAYHAMKPHLY